MTFNSLLMFDIVFVFFLFLVGVTCLVYYLPPVARTNSDKCRHSSQFNQFLNTHRLQRESHGFRTAINNKYCANVECYSNKNCDVEIGVTNTSSGANVESQCCYIKAKQTDVKKCSGPIQDV